MTLATPAINWNFGRTPRWIDPRATFSRSTTATGVSRIGLIDTVPANAARWRFNPVTGECEGILLESQRTNLILYSQEFDNAAHTKTTLTVTANSAVAPDGTTTGDTLAATGAGGNAAQAVTVTAGRGVAYSVYLKANATSWAVLKLSDGSNDSECWFNLATGVVGSNTAGASSLVFSEGQIIPMGNGWYRCILMVLTSAVTTITCSVAPTSADSTASANTDSLYAWGAQAEAPATSSNATSYIATTSATVTRVFDTLSIVPDTSWYNANAGTIFFDYIIQTLGPVGNHEVMNLGGLGESNNNKIEITRTSNTILTATFSSGGVSTLLTQTAALTPGSRVKAALAWASGDIAFCVGAATPSTGSAALMAATPTLFVVGNRTYTPASSIGVFSTCYAAQYYPFRASNADLQTLTAA